MRRSWDPTFLAVLLAVFMLMGTVLATGGLGPGQWRGDLPSGGDSVHLEFRLDDRDRHVRSSLFVETRELEGFDPGDFTAPGKPLHLAWKQDSGTFHLDGEGGRRPGGSIRFEPDPAFAERLRAIGFASPTDDDLLGFALHGIRLADAEKLRSLGIEDLDLRDLSRLADAPELIREFEAMRGLGFPADLDDAERLVAHGIGVDELRGYLAAGVTPDADAVIRLHNHGVEADYVRGCTAAGLAVDDLDGILRLHAHGIPTDYVAGIRASGIADPGVDEIVRLSSHGVPQDYAREVVAIGPGRRDADDIIRLHTHGVTTEFLRAYVTGERPEPTVDAVIRASTRGGE